jgi:hypothetical protein
MESQDQPRRLVGGGGGTVDGLNSDILHTVRLLGLEPPNQQWDLYLDVVGVIIDIAVGDIVETGM